MSIQLNAVSHHFGHLRVLDDISLSLEDGEILCVLGPSGSGKSTLLRIIAGLEPMQSGDIALDNAPMASSAHCPPPEQRPIGLVFQDHALFPHLTVAQNVAFGLGRLTATQRGEIVEQLLDRVGLTALAQRYPHTLSGGQQQRIALVRALAPKPRVMLLDEPFASVDTPLRRQLRQDARQELKQAGTTTIMVTHDPEEAMAMADRILVLVEGEAVQLDTPEALWQQPAHRFVAETIAGLQTLRGTVAGDHIVTVFGKLAIEAVRGANVLTANALAANALNDGQTVTLGVRGSSVSITDQVAEQTAHAAVEDIRFDGMHWTALVKHEDQQLRFVLDHKSQVQSGSEVALSFADVEAVLYS
ncbi:MAG: ABC transporter ATP-binding protein [Pseudomonadales bacterium]|nr:ABC transporter ATP-binding protein [Pseudomonadales bacterium]